MSDHDHEQSASDTFDLIRRGGVNLLVSSQARLIEAKELLDRGDFTGAGQATASAFSKIEALSTAQEALASMADKHVVRVKDVRPGMVLPDVGPIEAVGPCVCSAENCKKVSLTIAGETQVFYGEQEMLVQLPPSGD